jgi:hypothetical protein
MPPTDLPTAIATWIRHAEERRKDDFWAWDWVMTQVCWEAGAEDAWELVRTLVRAAPDELLEFVGAGPVEDLVERFGEVLVDRIETEARADPRFREALGFVWLTRGELPAEVEARVVAASGGRIEPLELTEEERRHLREES